MIWKITLKFQPSVKPLHKESEEDYWYLFKENKLMVYKRKRVF